MRARVGVVHLDEDVLRSLCERFAQQQRHQPASDSPVLQVGANTKTVQRRLAVVVSERADCNRRAVEPREVLPPCLGIERNRKKAFRALCFLRKAFGTDARHIGKVIMRRAVQGQPFWNRETIRREGLVIAKRILGMIRL